MTTPWTIDRRQDPEAVRQVLVGLPDWFGIDAAIDEYVEAAGLLDSYLALRNGRTVGVALRGQPAEIVLLAVEAGAHGQGLGSALLAELERDVRRAGGLELLVSTVGPGFVHAGYEATREFYRARGFRPVREFHDPSWGGPTVVLRKSLA